MKSKYELLVLFIISVIFLNICCADKKRMQENITPYGGFHCFKIGFSNIIYNIDGHEIKIPIFQGINGDIDYKTFIDYCHENKLLINNARESGFAIQAKKGQLKSTLHDFIRFYKKNILKDIDIEKPTWVGISDEWWYILYDFEVNKIPCYLKIEVFASNEDYENWNKDSKLTSPFQINPDETMKDPYFTYSFYINQKSTDKPGRFPGQ
ncbi:MAG TPA: hypothetical protein PK514_08940 [Spirochaetota bacterium]|nr:hypothetical protein [Spirochaetota bacterium]